YDDGDFISRRYYTRETPGKAAPFAIPYNGEEVKLHWANADQYYIKSTEYFSNFTFDLTQSREIREMSADERVLNQIPESPLKVHFRVVEASEGEHGNVKASDTQKRFFIIHHDKPVELNDAGELIINFEYRSDPEKSGQEGSWRDKRNAEAVETIFEALESMADPGAINESLLPQYSRLLKVPAPTEKDRTRPVLAKYLNQYTARNTMDYFIHKDLGSFLRRELDFYIKNEVMRLDDIENADAPAVESYLAKIKVLRTIAGKLIDFLAQLEDFQKKLWLKKKFVVETNYCITLDRVPEELYPEIAVNEGQIEEWVKLFAINEIEGDLVSPGYCNPLTVEFLKANNNLVLDTRFFDDDFKERLVASIDDFDDQCDGLLIHSENFQALNLLQERYREQVKCVHIDPPYNTATSGFLYKNEYQDSSWLAFMAQRIITSVNLMFKKGVFQCHIDENEYEVLFSLLEEIGIPNSGTVIWDKKNPMLGRKGIATQHEYILWRSYLNQPVYMRSETVQKILDQAQNIIKEFGGANENSRRKFSEWIAVQSDLSGGERAYKLIEGDGRVFRGVAMGAPEPRKDSKFHIPLIHPITNQPCPVPTNGWSRTPETLKELIEKDEILWGVYHSTQPQKKVYLTSDSKRQLSSVIQDAKSGKAYMDGLGLSFPYCHPVSLYEELIGAVEYSTGDVILDYFAGSGTTGHAVINLNREDGGKRKHILVEMGDYFDTVLKPRIAKVVYSENWKDGKPVVARPSRSGPERDALATTIKYIRLESYEDTLNNLQFDDNPARNKAVAANSSLKEDYMLHYLLDVETRGSQSLLNIDNFADPTSYNLKVKKPGTDEYVTRNVDLIETFNYLIGLRVTHIAAPQEITAEFTRIEDPEVPKDQKTKLVVVARPSRSGPERDALATTDGLATSATFWFRKIEGWVPKDPSNPNNGQPEKVLIVWRKLTGDLEKDNLMLDEWFQKNRISTRDFEFDTIYVNGSNNLPNLKRDDENWKVTLIEEEFMKRMWDVEGV
ncbi:MAG: site-specific DNA-methyltransferase, partial [Planctomycetota bacterium]